MRLLITTQAVDLDDPILAFFHSWIIEFSKRCESVEVICLKEGRHELPANVTVHSLEKEKGESNLKYIRLFYKHAWELRGRYDSVFVHMNPEYIVLGGLLWRILGKKVALWYIHPRSSWRLWVARIFSNIILSATEKSFPLRTKKLVAVGHGVDTEFFSPDPSRKSNDILHVMQAARIAPVKRIECVVGAISEMYAHNVPVSFDYYGSELSRDYEYAEAVKKLIPAAVPPGVWEWRGNATQNQIRDAYRAHDVHVNATVSGSFDKAVFESMACGCITVASNTALSDVLPEELRFKEGDAHSLAETLMRISRMDEGAQGQVRSRMRSIAEVRYSLTALIGRIVEVLA